MEPKKQDIESLVPDILDKGHDITESDVELVDADKTAMRQCRDAMLIKQTLCEESTDVDVESQLRKLRRRILLRRRRRTAARSAAVILAAAAAVMLAVLVLPTKPNGSSPTPGLVFRADNSADTAIRIERIGAEEAAPLTSDAAPSSRPAEPDTPMPIGQRLVVSVPKGNSYTLSLPDGSRAYMHADSRIVCPTEFVGTSRSIEMEGEIYFDIAHDSRRPFVIRSRRMTTTVLGTELNIRAYGDASDNVTLVSGRAAVAFGQSKTVLRPGEQAATDHNGNLKLKNVDTTPFTAWRDGLIYYDNADLEDVMKGIGRDYNCNVLFRDQRLMRYKIHFVAEQHENVDSVLSTLNRMKRIRVRRNGNTITID